MTGITEGNTSSAYMTMRYCVDRNKWCQSASSSGHCSLTACCRDFNTVNKTVYMPRDDIKEHQKKVGAIVDGIPGFETLEKTIEAAKEKQKNWKWSGQFINDMEDTAIEMLIATGWLYRHDKEISRGQGHWNHEVWEAPLSDSMMNVYECSECGLHYQSESNFCPNCGADMRASMKRGE